MFSATFVGPQFGVPLIIDRSVFPIKVEYMVTIAGPYTCSVFMNGIPISSSSFGVAISPAVSSQRESIIQAMVCPIMLLETVYQSLFP